MQITVTQAPLTDADVVCRAVTNRRKTTCVLIVALNALKDLFRLIDLGGKRLRQISTPHVPHAWEAQVLYEEVTGTLLCGDLFTQLGNGPALTTDDIVGPAMFAEEVFHSRPVEPQGLAGAFLP